MVLGTTFIDEGAGSGWHFAVAAAGWHGEGALGVASGTSRGAAGTSHGAAGAGRSTAHIVHEVGPARGAARRPWAAQRFVPFGTTPILDGPKAFLAFMQGQQ